MTRVRTMKQTWQSYGEGRPLPDIEELRKSSSRFDRQIRVRNAIEYAAAGVVILGFSIIAALERAPLLRLSYAMIVAGACFVAWQLGRRASAVRPARSASTVELLGEYRKQIERQRDALQSVWLWYLLPFAPGLLLSFVATPVPPGREWAHAASVLFTLTVFVGVWMLNRHAALRLQGKIEELDALKGEIE